MADPWYKDIDKAYIQRCRALAAKVWADKLQEARERGWGEDEEDRYDPFAGIEVSYHLPGAGYVSLSIGDDTVLKEVLLDRLEPALLALRGPKEARDG